MTAEEKSRLWSSLDIVDSYLRDGYRRNSEPPSFRDDSEPSTAADSLEAIYQEVAACSTCRLAATRRNTVPGEGVDRPLVLVVGEGPGADEDACGRPFVGRAGQLLDRMLASIGLDRKTNCYIGNIVKCRPPGNRNPHSDEEHSCFGFLERQIALLQPHFILSLGNVPTKFLLNTNEGITKLRGQWASFRGIPLLPSFHPSALLRDESLKRPAWEDLKSLRAELDRETDTSAGKTSNG